MMRVKWVSGVAAIIFAAVLSVSSAHAVTMPYVADAFNSLGFRNAEVFMDNDGSKSVSVGDVFWGVLKLNDIVNAGTDDTGQTGTQIWPTDSTGIVPPPEITGYFSQRVDQVIDQGNNLYTLTFGTVGAAGDPNGKLADGEFIRFYEGAFDYNTTTQVQGLTTATNGDFIFSLGVGDNAYWYTPNVALDPTIVGPIGSTYAGLNFIVPLPWGNVVVNDPNESVYDTDVDMWFNSEIFTLNTGGQTNWSLRTGDMSVDPFHLGSNDPAVYYPVPEPSTMVLLGAGLLGMVFFRNRKK